MALRIAPRQQFILQPATEPILAELTLLQLMEIKSRTPVTPGA
jgi:hypothetical protein